MVLSKKDKEKLTMKKSKETLKNYMIFFNRIYGDIESNITSKIWITAYNKKEAIDIFVKWLKVTNRNAEIVDCKKVSKYKGYIPKGIETIEQRYNEQYLIIERLKRESERK